MGMNATETAQQEGITVGYGIFTVFSSICFFQIMNYVAFLIGTPACVEKKAPFWKWKNLLISWIHALIVGSWDLSCFYFYPEMMTDLIEHLTVYSYTMVAVSTGYFIYDFIDIIRTGRLKSSWEVVTHHVFVTSTFFYNVITIRCIAYNCIALLAEVNSFFLHSRKLLQMLQVDYNHPIYRTNVYLNLISFIVGRFGGVTAIIIGMFIWYDKVSVFYYSILFAAVFVMFFINLILFGRLIKNDIMRPRRQAKLEAEKAAAEALSNNNVREVRENGVMKNGVAHSLRENGLVYENGHTKKDI